MQESQISWLTTEHLRLQPVEDWFLGQGYMILGKKVVHVSEVLDKNEWAWLNISPFRVTQAQRIHPSKFEGENCTGYC